MDSGMATGKSHPVYLGPVISSNAGGSRDTSKDLPNGVPPAQKCRWGPLLQLQLLYTGMWHIPVPVPLCQ